MILVQLTWVWPWLGWTAGLVGWAGRWALGRHLGAAGQLDGWAGLDAAQGWGGQQRWATGRSGSWTAAQDCWTGLNRTAGLGAGQAQPRAGLG